MKAYSVVICTFNGEMYISKQIESILFQPHRPCQILISDDGSSDSTLEIINKILQKYNFRNYTIIDGPKRCAKYNFLFALKYIETDYIFFADQDDIWHPNKIELFTKYLYNTGSPLLAFSDSEVIDENENLISSSFFEYQGLTKKVFEDDSILFKNCVQGATVCINKPMRELILKSLDYVNIDNLYMHDWWIALLAKYFGEFVFIPESLIKYRQHSNNQIGAFDKKGKWKLYLKNYRLFIKNFHIAIKQAKELEKFYIQKNGYFYSIKEYKYIPTLKRVLLKIIFLQNKLLISSRHDKK